jgi:ABC-2 type transport system ATP-binding protein
MNLIDIHLSYGKEVVISGLNLHVPPQSVMGLVGVNGVGKTTLLNAIFGTKPLSQGKIEWEGSPLQPRQIAFLETEQFFYPKITGREYLEICRLANKKADVDGLNALFDLPLHKLVDTYSTGMKKKLAFMGVLALDRPLLLLDEPFNGVDLESVERIKLAINHLRLGGKTILLTSHILETLTDICDKIAVLVHRGGAESYEKAQFAELTQHMQQTLRSKAGAQVAKALASLAPS